MAQVTGIVKIYVDGALQRSKPGAKLKLGGVKREAVVGHSLYGFTEEVEPAELDCTLAHTADTDLPALNALKNANLRFETDTGTTYLVTNAFTTESCEVTSGGDTSLKMMGDPAIEE